MRELVVLSGKGGTGKTSLAASFAVLAERAVAADCDVDASDLHLLLSPRVRERKEFTSGREAVVRPERCRGCGRCRELCRFDAVSSTVGAGGKVFCTVDPMACEGCGVCVRSCPEGAIDFVPRTCGEWFVSDARCGPLVHARLGIAAENSGKLVTLVRRKAREIGEAEGRELLIVDGPPGIGCPVIASLTGASAALVVTEPTLSGEHDLERVLALARHFGIAAAVCVNKWDLNPQRALLIEEGAAARGARVMARIRYDRGVTSAQIEGRAVVETGASSAPDVWMVWEQVQDFMQRASPLPERRGRV